MATADAVVPQEFSKLFIDGSWHQAESTFDVINPATEAVVARAPNGSRTHVDAAVAAARRAFDDGPWRRTTPADRARVLRNLGDALQRRKEILRGWLISTAGAEYMTHHVQLEKPFEQLAQYADLALRYPFDEPLPVDVMPTPVGNLVSNAVAHRQPVGVCGLIPTWNFPLYISVQKIGPALATGCTMVVKPSPWASIIDLVIAEAIEECDLPPGVFNVVTGENPDLGAALVESPLVDKISYTGSVATGKRILAAASATMKRVHLELGGKSAAIVLDDANLDAIAPALATPSYFHAGQGCALCTRVLVSESRHDALVERVAAFVRNVVKVGNPVDPSVMLGPVIRAERRAQIEQYIDSAQREGAVLAAGGSRPEHLPHGYFLQPTVFADVRENMTIAREEIFGPVLSIMSVYGEDDAVRLANQSGYGLSGAIYTADPSKGMALARRIRTGTVNINGSVSLLHAPFGGFKESGIGREGGRWGMDEFTEVQTITWRS